MNSPQTPVPNVPPPTLPPPPSAPLNPYAAPVTHPANMAAVSGKSAALVEAVMSGVRFRTIPYVFSVVIMTFRRSMGGVHTVAPGKWPTGELCSAALISALFGWWGFPWGLIWTIPTLWHLCHGGKDHTKAVLTAEIGPAEAARVLSQAAKPKPPGSIWLVRAIACIPLLIIGALVLFSNAVEKEEPSGPYRKYQEQGNPAGSSRHPHP